MQRVIWTSEFFTMYGDSYLPVDFNEVHRYFEDSRATACMTVYRNRSLYDKSNVVFRDGIVEAYDKKHFGQRWNTSTMA